MNSCWLRSMGLTPRYVWPCCFHLPKPTQQLNRLWIGQHKGSHPHQFHQWVRSHQWNSRERRVGLIDFRGYLLSLWASRALLRGSFGLNRIWVHQPRLHLEASQSNCAIATATKGQIFFDTPKWAVAKSSRWLGGRHRPQRKFVCSNAANLKVAGVMVNRHSGWKD